ncbi:undecaprenyl-phosphate galactose phosphotransferase WbaP [Pectinatus haikarae]|uniref:Undecaprenyl-phosphate galactose phosphotransferase n=1 Tax=Pectinatus haikarae TaxID=349096 RepID=A0ABT9YC30_9FIRM|nr:undecaprenyl-phosphate galactose phosphotransferase WbaP [Pectinatus haikarae]MDQ0205183.1 undecaprenyl-phosphate galactose phosphotransferase [Pectinatus haikarae]
MKCEKLKTNKIDDTVPYMMPFLLLGTDYLAILTAQKIAMYLRQHIRVFSIYYSMPDVPNMYFYFLVPIVFIAFLYNSHIYVNRMPFWEVIQKIFYAVVLSMMVCIMLMYFGHIAGGVSRLYVALSGMTAFAFLCIFRYILKKILFKFNILSEPIIIIGAGKTAELVVRQFSNDTGFGVKVVGFIDDSPVSDDLPKQYPVLGKFSEAESIIKETGVKTIIIAAPGLEKYKLLELVDKIQPLVKDLSFVPDLIGIPVGNIEIQRLYDAKIMMLRVSNNMSRWYNKLLKRTSDVLFGNIIFILFVPVLLIIAIAIKKDSDGTVFYNAKRIGKNDKEFTCYKFRTMYEDADDILRKYLQENPVVLNEWKTYRKIKGYDPRVTKVGRWLRKYSLDELPQIINVIKGDMSIVGPRPYLPTERQSMGNHLNTIKENLPGITGLWQVSGRNEVSFTDRLLMDTWYIQNWSIWIDIVLIYKTVFVVLYKKGAY